MLSGGQKEIKVVEMNRGLLHQSPLVQIMGGSPMMMRPPIEQSYCSLPPSSSSTTMTPCHDSQFPPLSWSQLLLGGSYAGEDEKHDAKIIESCWENQIADASTGAKHESCGSGYMIQSPRSSEVIVQASRCSWSHQVLTPPVSSNTVRSNLLEFSNTIKPADSSPECNSTATGGALKRAKIQGSFAAHSTLKVRKEKLGDRITALHQIVSPFGKTDTASVLQEAIGYIRFLQSQIEVLTTPYLSSTSGNMKQPPTESTVEDLRSRGLCLMPLSFILHVGRDFEGSYLGSF
ncbi:transcription factor bHLH68-like [Zingiber officinale]|uniref:BHLH domain-containing protein n=1 Tax=Zingiber officinale TaxID=94328 RepID=A0A8J5HSG3_ZINOF|nr:transcription factor bHLH68-like [Zingiber officinale]KAG6534577.1 hypothetical protein ZIOFF_008480 [Zingiber officinale]